MTRRQIALAVAVVVLGAGAVRRIRLVRAVPASLRLPALYLPLSIRSRVHLRIARRMLTVSSDPGEGVVHSIHHADAGPDGHSPVVHLYEPAERTGRGAVLWIHGGGYVAGVPEAEHAWCARIARDLGVPVANVGYRLAPEHPFPAGLEDCHAALRWLAGLPGVDPDRVAISGGSAGGGLAAALAQLAHARGEVRVAFQLLEYPMLDDRTVDRPVSRRPWLVWTPASNRFGWRAYLGVEPGSAHVPDLAAPARTEDLSGLPPAWIGVGDLDLFHDECVDYARRLTAAGVPCELRIEPGLFHGADDEGDPERSPITSAWRTRMIDALRPHVV